MDEEDLKLITTLKLKAAEKQSYFMASLLKDAEKYLKNELHKKYNEEILNNLNHKT